jgi:hypothetical protein
MPPERLDRLRVIVVTALVTCVVTLVSTAVVATVVNRLPPPTPQLAPPKTITVTLYPLNGLSKAYPPTEIPPGDVDQVMRLVTPDIYYEGGVHDWITPLIAEVVITHEGQPDTHLLVRWAGANPAMISVDGRNYFYGVPHKGIKDGGAKLVGIVQEIAITKGR